MVVNYKCVMRGARVMVADRAVGLTMELMMLAA